MKQIKILFFSLVAIVLVGITGVYLFFYQANEHYRRHYDTAIELVSESNLLKQVSSFYLYVGDTTYYTVYGIDQNNVPTYVIINKETYDAFIYPASQFISESVALQRARSYASITELLNTRVRMSDQMPVWEISYKDGSGFLGYVLINAQTGNIITNIVSNVR